MTSTVLPAPVPPSRLANALASEWTKIRSVQSTIWTFATMFATVLGIGLMADLYQRGRDDVGSYLGLGVGGFIIGTIPVVTLGVLVISSEYGTGMIRTTLTAYPRRTSLLTAKALVLFGLTFALGTLAVGTQVLGGMVLLSGQGVDPSAGQITLAVIGGGLYLALIGLFALGVGTLLRHSAGAIATMLGLLLMPFILAVLMPLADLRDLLLTYSPINMSASLFGDGAGSTNGWALLGILALGTAAVLGGAYAAILRRDV